MYFLLGISNFLMSAWESWTLNSESHVTTQAWVTWSVNFQSTKWFGMFLHENHDQSFKKDTYLNQNRIHEHYDCKFLTSLCDFMSVHENHDQPIWKSKISDIQEGWIMITMIYEFWHSFLIVYVTEWWSWSVFFEEYCSGFKLKSWAQWSNISKKTLLFLWFFYDYHDHSFRKMFCRTFLIYEAWIDHNHDHSCVETL